MWAKPTAISKLYLFLEMFVSNDHQGSLVVEQETFTRNLKPWFVAQGQIVLASHREELVYLSDIGKLCTNKSL